ncbi:uncharacterized protein LOC100596047 isoform X3 [Nomascus leucogenys]|uniref:uncharacterized protein LOC100596047 isoform X3 n=1 Tax=Nomascus leucogenys TaxID=61853 RepID=UPI00122DBBB6|nr:uncharacterized protein LOC100596047 isoform X3 [Nomascus leucogenys]
MWVTVIRGCGCGLHPERVAAAGPGAEDPVLGCDAGELQPSALCGLNCLLAWKAQLAQHKSFNRFSRTGCQVSKPAVISSLEQWKEPRMEEEEIRTWSFPES